MIAYEGIGTVFAKMGDVAQLPSVLAAWSPDGISRMLIGSGPGLYTRRCTGRDPAASSILTEGYQRRTLESRISEVARHPGRRHVRYAAVFALTGLYLLLRMRN